MGRGWGEGRACAPQALRQERGGLAGPSPRPHGGIPCVSQAAGVAGRSWGRQHRHRPPATAGGGQWRAAIQTSARSSSVSISESRREPRSSSTSIKAIDPLSTASASFSWAARSCTHEKAERQKSQPVHNHRATSPSRATDEATRHPNTQKPFVIPAAPRNPPADSGPNHICCMALHRSMLPQATPSPQEQQQRPTSLLASLSCS